MKKNQKATETFTMRISPQVHAMLKILAEHEGRTKSNMVNRIIREKFESITDEINKKQSDQ
jgi:predicted DNA-binding protein